jgi:anti-anti-sigma regulatory factor
LRLDIKPEERFTSITVSGRFVQHRRSTDDIRQPITDLDRRFKRHVIIDMTGVFEIDTEGVRVIQQIDDDIRSDGGVCTWLFKREVREHLASAKAVENLQIAENIHQAIELMATAP